MQRIHEYFADIWDHVWGFDIRGMPLIIINLIIIKSCLVQSPIIYNCDIYTTCILQFVILTCILPVSV